MTLRLPFVPWPKRNMESSHQRIAKRRLLYIIPVTV